MSLIRRSQPNLTSASLVEQSEHKENAKAFNVREQHLSKTREGYPCHRGLAL